MKEEVQVKEVSVKKDMSLEKEQKTDKVVIVLEEKTAKNVEVKEKEDEEMIEK